MRQCVGPSWVCVVSMFGWANFCVGMCACETICKFVRALRVGEIVEFEFLRNDNKDFFFFETRKTSSTFSFLQIRISI